MQLCFFNDQIASNFLPLTLTRPVDDLRIGILTIREKWEKVLKPTSISRLLDEHLHGVFEKGELDSDSPTLWLNSRYLPTFELIQTLQKLEVGSGIWDKEMLVATLVDDSASIEAFEKNSHPDSNFKAIEHTITFTSISYFWDMLALNGNQIKADISHFNYNPLHQSKFATSCISVNPEQIFVADSAIIEPGCTLLAQEGPIFIGAGASIEAGSILRGPVAICEGAVVKMAARIFAGSTLGPVCKAGGEVNNVIFHSYSNKAHDGFLGNSVVGQWCNFGADTNTSNLKNNYSPVKLPHWETGALPESGVQFFGTVMGDHSKTAINTALNTGTICGVSSNIFCSGFPSKKTASFSWLSDNGTELYNLEKAIETMRTVMKRRGIELTPAYEHMMKHIHSHR